MSRVEDSYRRYLELGGIINEKDHQSTIDRMNSRTLETMDMRVRNSIRQARKIAEYSGIELTDSGDTLDPKIILYVILRLDTKPKEVEYHHEQMSDQRIFAEVLRMLGDEISLDKLVKAHPHISFKYERG